MNEEKIYDVAIIGGGLAGLTLAVLLSRHGISVVLFEKEKYPFHKVCGEYISMESWDFLTKEIGIPLQQLNVAVMNKLLVTSPNGNELTSSLVSGGFGISRYKIDNIIKEIAEKNGALIKDDCKVDAIDLNGEIFTVKTSCGEYRSKVCCGSWGKRSNIDVKWKRPFITKRSERLNNYVGIKYHVKGSLPTDTIALHNFENGYCGVSKIEDDIFCLCYLMKASNLKRCGGSIERTERQILSQNPHLKKIFNSIQKINGVPLSISQISLSDKSAIENNILMLGDAAGMISPLCGNGMSIAMHSSKLAAVHIVDFLNGNISRKQMENGYTRDRKAAFQKRIRTGKLIQYLFGRKTATNIFVALMKKSRLLTKKIIELTHGESF